MVNTFENWKPIIVNKDKKFPFLIIDNWCTKEEESLVWKELDYFLSFSKDTIPRAENGKDVARDKEEKSLAKGYRFYLDTYFTNKGRKFSHILNLNYKFQHLKFHSLIENTCSIGRLFKKTNNNTTMLTYYENEDYYKEHFDISYFTSLVWFFKNPKNFDGGELNFPEINTTINLKNNRMLFFPSYYFHQVKPIKFLNKNKELGYGKFTISNFFNIFKGEDNN